jgi:hypothetical protein
MKNFLLIFCFVFEIFSISAYVTPTYRASLKPLVRGINIRDNSILLNSPKKSENPEDGYGPIGSLIRQVKT